MSYYQQRSKTKLTIGQSGNALTMLIAINLVVFVLLAFIKVVYYLSFGTSGVASFNEDILKWITLPADMSVFITRPWTLLTHMFAHDTDRIWHILGNMIWLWVFGAILQDLAGNKKVFPLFFYGGFFGALAYVLAYNFLPPLKLELPLAYALGASAGVMAIAIGATALAPNYRIFPMLNGGIPIWVITVVYLIIDLATIPSSNPGGHIAHIAGAGAGYMFILSLQRGKDWGAWMNDFFDWVNNLFNPDIPKKGKVVQSNIFYKASVPPFKKTPSVTQQRIDDILDKINQKGYSSLSDDEKELLKRASKEDLF